MESNNKKISNEAKKILIVEDDKDYLWTLKESFKELGDVRVFYAIDGEEGLEIAKREKPDLVLVDILMPKLDGIAMVKELKREGIGSIIIFLTNLSDEKHISEALESGVEMEYIVKADVHVRDVIEKVKSKLKL